MGVFAAARDVTERRRAEQAVRAERQRFNDVLETLPAYLALLTPDHHVPFANRFFRERFGESHGKRCFEYLFGRTEPCETCETYTVLKTNKPHHGECTGPDGRNYDIYDFPFTDTDGSPLIMEMGIDVTERKRATEALRLTNETLEQRVAERTQALQKANERRQAQAEELQAANEKLCEREKELRLVMNTVPALIAYVDSRFRYRWVNQGYERWFGLPAPEVEGRHVRDVLGRKAWETVRPYLQRALAGEVVTYEERMPYRLGESRWVHVTCVPDRVEAGRVQGFIAHVTDVTKRKHAEEKIQQQNAILEGINRVFEKALTCETEEDLGRTCLAVAEETTGSRFGFLGQINAEGRLDDIAISDPGWKACRMTGSGGHRRPPRSFEIHGIYGRVFRDGKGFFTNDPASHPDRIGLPRGHPPLRAFPSSTRGGLWA